MTRSFGYRTLAPVWCSMIPLPPPLLSPNPHGMIIAGVLWQSESALLTTRGVAAPPPRQAEYHASSCPFESFAKDLRRISQLDVVNTPIGTLSLLGEKCHGGRARSPKVHYPLRFSGAEIQRYKTGTRNPRSVAEV